MMNEETLNLDKLTLDDNYINVEATVDIEHYRRLALSLTKSKSLLKGQKGHKQEALRDMSHKKNEFQKSSLKRKHDLEDTSDEQMEKMARLVIEDSMSLAVIRRCWRCKHRFVKEGECTAVRCVCGATTCYSCGHYITNNLVTAHLGCAAISTPGEDRERVRRAALRAKRALSTNHPTLTFKYDPSGSED